MINEFVPPGMINEFVPPGHFYSVIPNITDTYNNANPKFLDLDFNDKNHLYILNDLKNNLEDFCNLFCPLNNNASTVLQRKNELKYSLMNGSFEWMDARILYYFLKKNKPKKIIEIGSGNSTLLMYNTKKRFNLDLEIICIEPYPEESTDITSDHNWLRILANKGEITLIDKKLENVDVELFRELGENDILFIDSTHVAKLDSDVMYYFTKIFPLLNTGVMVHIHDIFFPYDYSLDWLKEGRFWNEQYLLYVFLQFNTKFVIQFCNSYALYKFKDKLKDIQKNSYEFKNKIVNDVFGGGSIWLKVY